MCHRPEKCVHVSGRYVACLVVVIVLTAGCSTSALPAEQPVRNATLSLSDYERTGAASPVETRTFWDRSKSWEDPGNRTATITSRANAYRNTSGAEAVVVYTTPTKRYVGADRIRSLSAPDMARLATGATEAPTAPLGNDTGRSYRGSLLGEEVTVRTVIDDTGTTTGHVAHVVRDDVIVIVVVGGEADRATVERVLDAVTLFEGLSTDG
jgi:hypothetical protein